MADAGDGRAEFDLVIQSEQIHAGFGGIDQVGNREMGRNRNRNKGKKTKEEKGRGQNGLRLNSATRSTYTVQQADSLQTIAERYSDGGDTPRWTTAPASLILANRNLTTLILPGVQITVDVAGEERQYTTRPGDAFETVAEGLGITIDELAEQTVLYGREDWLAPTIRMFIPTIDYTSAPDGGDTLSGIIGLFAMPLAQLIDVEANQNVPNFFDAAEQNTIQIANLQRLSVAALWAAIVRGDQVAQTAGMAARYQLHGMRLPNLAGLTLPANFLYPTSGQPAYGLYQLTGQQFPTPPYEAGADYRITLSKDASLDWIAFKGDPGETSLALDLSKQFCELDQVLQFAHTTGYQPNPTLTVQPGVELAPKRYTIRSLTLWSPADQSQLAAATAPGSSVEPLANEQAQAQPMIWSLPQTLLQSLEKRQAALAAKFNARELVPYLPVLQPEVGTYDPATRATTYAPIVDYAFATRIDFQVKNLAQDDDPAPQTPFANDVVPPDDGNPGSPAQPLAPFNYELIGPGPADAVLLQRLLTAMDSLGEEIISGLYILYADNGSAPNELVSRAPAAFLSFITQTNLSTETNPPPLPAALVQTEAGQPPRGIANQPAEFVKLMWELSTVRSGGYYLYYELAEEGIGLPDDIFDDSGLGTLTLIMTFRRDATLVSGERLSDYVNTFVTTENIDRSRSVVGLRSESSPATTPPLDGSETLQSLAELYGIGVGTLDKLNVDASIVAGTQIPITSASHQVTPADLAAGDVLEKLAERFSVGVETPITAADIQNFNPGLTAELYAVFRIPPIRYVVSPAAEGPGDSLGSMHRYYGLSIDALSYAARQVPEPFAAGTILNTDSQNFDAQPALGVGNIDIEMTRADLGDPPDIECPGATPEQSAEFAEKYLFSLYNLLTAGFFGNAFFQESMQGLSFGPRRSLSEEEAQAIRRPESRRAFFAAQDEDRLEYAQAFGITDTFSDVNPAPEPSDPVYLLPRAANPYIGVGTLAQLRLRWTDIFGNRTVTPFQNPPQDDQGPLNNPPVPVDYVDPLMGLDAWPNVRSFYIYGGTPDSPQLLLTFELNTQAYEPASNAADARSAIALTGLPAWQQSAENDQKIFTAIYFQLNQNYDDLDPQIPGLSGNAVTMSVTNTLLTDPEIPFTGNNADYARMVREFVANCLVYVTKRAQNEPGGETPRVELSLSVPITSLSPENIIPLSLTFGLSRQAALSAPALRGIANGLTTNSLVRPLTDEPPVDPNANADEPPTQSLKRFADAAERVFDTDAWQLRIGTGTITPDQPRNPDAFMAWAVRLGKEVGSGLYFKIGSQPSFYAPQPVATELRSEAVELDQYTTGTPYPDGDPVTVTFTGADMNVWVNTALAAIDTFLSPTFAAPAFILDHLFFDDPETEGYLAHILDHKQTLAEAISRTMEPILVTSSSAMQTRNAAKEKMLQALLNKLSSAFTVTAVTVFPVTDASTNRPLPPNSISAPRFFGQPQRHVNDNARATNRSDNENFSLSTAKIQLQSTEVNPVENSDESHLAFLFSSKNVEAQSHVSVPLEYALTHLEYNITNVPGIENYEQSNWISFVNGPFVSLVGEPDNGGVKPIDFPVVLRALPTPPTVTEQTFAPAEPDVLGFAAVPEDATPADLATWFYAFSYNSQSDAAQDTVTAKVEFNVGDTVASRTPELSEALFKALAQFIVVNPAISRDLDTFLRQVDGNSKADDDDVINAKEAVAAFEAIVKEATEAYTAWADAEAALEAEFIPKVSYEFDIVLRNQGGEARIDIRNVRLEPPEATVPVPVILISPDLYDVEPVEPPEGAVASYRYRCTASAPETSCTGEGYLSFDAARELPLRTVRFGPLNIFAFQNAWAMIQVVRNQFLVPDVATTNPFRFRTPQVRFADPLVPLLDYDRYPLTDNGQVALEDALNAFFESLFNGVEAQQVTVKMESVFSYLIVESISELPRTILPVNLLPPTATTPQPGEPPIFVDPLASDVIHWLTEHAPVRNPSSEINFQLDVFAGQDESQTQQMPLLRIRDLFIDANEVE